MSSSLKKDPLTPYLQVIDVENALTENEAKQVGSRDSH